MEKLKAKQQKKENPCVCKKAAYDIDIGLLFPPYEVEVQIPKMVVVYFGVRTWDVCSLSLSHPRFEVEKLTVCVCAEHIDRLFSGPAIPARLVRDTWKTRILGVG